MPPTTIQPDIAPLLADLSFGALYPFGHSVRKIGMKYDRSLFGMKISDAMSLAKCMKLTETLTSLMYVSNAPCSSKPDERHHGNAGGQPACCSYLTFTPVYCTSLPCNMIDDDLLRMLMTGLIHNQTITHLGT